MVVLKRGEVVFLPSPSKPSCVMVPTPIPQVVITLCSTVPPWTSPFLSGCAWLAVPKSCPLYMRRQRRKEAKCCPAKAGLPNVTTM